MVNLKFFVARNEKKEKKKKKRKEILDILNLGVETTVKSCSNVIRESGSINYAAVMQS